jgi:hypothetical protein
MQSGNNFKADLQRGKDGENLITEFLTKNGTARLISTNDTKSHDVIIEFTSPHLLFGSGKKSFEIKTDLLITPEKDTGNVFIEYTSWNKPSGIEVCQADWFIYHLVNFKEAWCVQPEKLRFLLREQRKTLRKVQGGDKISNTWGFLLKRRDWREHFHIMAI